MLADIHQKLDIKGSVNSKLVADALWNQQDWAIRWEHDFLFEPESNPPKVSYVVDVLDMWRFIKGAYIHLPDDEKLRVESTVPYGGGKDPTFPGFDGNEEGEYYAVACMLIETMGRFSEFSGQPLNSHSNTTERYRKMLEVFRPIRKSLASLPRVDLSADQIIEILSAPYKK